MFFNKFSSADCGDNDSEFFCHHVYFVMAVVTYDEGTFLGVLEVLLDFTFCR